MRQNLFKLNYYRSFKLQHKLCCIIIHRIFSTFWFFIENLKLRVQKLFKGIFKWIRSFLGFSWFFVQIHLSYFNWSNLKIQSRFNNTTINLVRPYHHVKNLHRRLVELIAFPVSGFPVQTKILLTLCVKNNKAINDLKSIIDLEFVPTWFCWKGDTYYSFSKSFNILTRCSGIPRM